MTKLFIIGNGFDMAHGLKTSYNNFLDYMKKEYSIVEDDIFEVPIPVQTRDGGIEYDEHELASYTVKILSDILGDDWNEFENALGYTDFLEDDLEDIYPLDNEGDLDMWKVVNINEDKSQICYYYCKFLKKMFKEWIESIDLSTISNKFIMIERDNLYINFNYTKTLEENYKIVKNNIFHIHGEISSELIFGHGKTYEEIREETEKMIGSNAVGSESNIERARDQLRKKTEEVLENNKKYFNDLKKRNIEKVVVYGFSFADVDLSYINEIENNLDKNIEWEIYFYKKNKLEGQVKKTKIKNYKFFECSEFI